MFGRMFGRKKDEPAAEPVGEVEDDEANAWVLPGEESNAEDVRVAEVPSDDWAPVEDDEPFEATVDVAMHDEAPAPVMAQTEEAWSFVDNDVHDEEPIDDTSDEWAPEAFEPAVASLAVEEADADDDEVDAISANVTPTDEEVEVVFDADGPIGAVASVEAPVEEVAAEKPWWENAEPDNSAEEDAAIEAVASVEVPVEDVAAEKPWWENAEPDNSAEEDAPIEAVASVEAPIEEAIAGTPWSENAETEDSAEDQPPVEAVASVETPVEEVAAEKPWWENAETEESAEDDDAG